MLFLRKLLLASLLIAGACAPDRSDDASPVRKAGKGSDTAGLVEKRAPSCPVSGTILPGNRFYASQRGLLVYLLADSTTYDSGLGDSHRVLEVFRAEDCERLDREVLPIDRSPDFAYQLADITYNNVKNQLGIKGFSRIYCYDLAQLQLLPGVEPTFLKPRDAVDAQSGLIRKLEVWENYLMGYAQDYGPFAFRLREGRAPEPVLPEAEYLENGGRYHALFILSSSGKREQVIVAFYDRQAGQLRVEPLFGAPQPLPGRQLMLTPGQQFALLLYDSERTAVDLATARVVSLPSQLEGASSEAIMEYLEGLERG